MISVVISGSGGFIGKHLISKLSKQKIKIIKMSKIFGDISKKKKLGKNYQKPMFLYIWRQKPLFQNLGKSLKNFLIQMLLELKWP